MNRLSEAQIEKAVNWWAEAIKNPQHDNGDESQHGGFARAAAFLGVQKVSARQIEIFKQELRSLLLSHEEAKWGLHVDYSPDAILAEALKRSAISELNAPWKTHMHFYPNDVVKVSCGYGANSEEI